MLVMTVSRMGMKYLWKTTEDENYNSTLLLISENAPDECRTKINR